MILPHPVHITLHLGQRQAETVAQAARYHQARLAEPRGMQRSPLPRAGIVAVIAIAVLVLLVVASATIDGEPSANSISHIARQ